MSKRVSIQGFEGSFHQEAAQAFYGDKVEVIPCSTFREMIRIAGKAAACDGGVMAIENSIAGSILPNYNLLQKSELVIIGEVYLMIKQNLMVFPGVKAEDIREVHSHPMALLQCTDYLYQHKWKLVESEDTALSAKHIHQYKHKHRAAIASALAARLNGLEIVAAGIENEKHNYTRFLILSNKEHESIGGANKASINFQTKHQKGSLANVLTAIAKEDINLSKLQSFPIPGSNWKYSFHVDMEFDNREQFDTALERIKDVVESVRIYGVYRKGVI